MAEVIVDKEKLAYGLKAGIAESQTIYWCLSEEHMLRASPCGLVSSGIHQYCLANDIPIRLAKGNPGWDFDPQFEHVVPWVGEEDETDPTIVDASFSQFLGLVGLSHTYEIYAGTKHFPDEEILVFHPSERERVAAWLTDCLTDFQPIRTKVYDRGDLVELSEGELADADPITIFESLEAIWDPANYKVWTPPERVANHGRQIAPHIPDGAIEIH